MGRPGKDEYIFGPLELLFVICGLLFIGAIVGVFGERQRTEAVIDSELVESISYHIAQNLYTRTYNSKDNPKACMYDVQTTLYHGDVPVYYNDVLVIDNEHFEAIKAGEWQKAKDVYECCYKGRDDVVRKDGLQ